MLMLHFNISLDGSSAYHHDDEDLSCADYETILNFFLERHHQNLVVNKTFKVIVPKVRKLIHESE